MTDIGEPNGRGNRGASGIIPASLAGFFLATIGTIVHIAYQREQDAQALNIQANRDGIAELNLKREGDAYERGRIDQTLVQLGEQGARQRDRIEQVREDLDSSLQREMRTLDDAMLVQIRDLDSRIQGEITRRMIAEQEAMAVLREEVERLRREWERFEDQLGVKRTLRP